MLFRMTSRSLFIVLGDTESRDARSRTRGSLPFAISLWIATTLFSPDMNDRLRVFLFFAAFICSAMLAQQGCHIMTP